MSSKKSNNKSQPVVESIGSGKLSGEFWEQNVDQYVPKEFTEHYVVKKPIGLRVYKQDCRITHVLPDSSLLGKAFTGDTIAEVDGKTISNGDELQVKLREKSKIINLRVRHAFWSCCYHLRTTVEKIQIDRETVKITSFPVNHYYIFVKMKKFPEIPSLNLGLFVKYNNRDRLEVTSLTPGSMAAVHLKIGDVITECNGKPLCSKAVLRHSIMASVATSGHYTLLVEAPIRDTIRDHIDVAEDVIQIADKEIEDLKRESKNMARPPCALDQKKPAQSTKRIKIGANERTEHMIVSDMDPSRLKPCKNAT